MANVSRYLVSLERNLIHAAARNCRIVWFHVDEAENTFLERSCCTSVRTNSPTNSALVVALVDYALDATFEWAASLVPLLPRRTALVLSYTFCGREQLLSSFCRLLLPAQDFTAV